MTSKTENIHCPKCQCRDLNITESWLESRTARLKDGVFISEPTLSTGMPDTKLTGNCLNPTCKHEWTLRSKVSLDNIHITHTMKIIHYTCITCKQPSKIVPANFSTFDPKNHECINCELGLND